MFAMCRKNNIEYWVEAKRREGVILVRLTIMDFNKHKPERRSSIMSGEIHTPTTAIYKYLDDAGLRHIIPDLKGLE